MFVGSFLFLFKKISTMLVNVEVVCVRVCVCVCVSVLLFSHLQPFAPPPPPVMAPPTRLGPAHTGAITLGFFSSIQKRPPSHQKAKQNKTETKQRFSTTIQRRNRLQFVDFFPRFLLNFLSPLPLLQPPLPHHPLTPSPPRFSFFPFPSL